LPQYTHKTNSLGCCTTCTRKREGRFLTFNIINMTCRHPSAISHQHFVPLNPYPANVENRVSS